MDISPKQAEEIEEIEKQLSPSNEPHIISEKVTDNTNLLKNLLAAFGIIVVGGSAMVLLIIIPFAKKKTIVTVSHSTTTTTTIPISSGSSITVETEYTNPFDSKTQYENPFIASRNPFSNLEQ